LKYILNRQGHPFYGYHKYGHVGSGHGAKKGKRSADPETDPYSPRGTLFAAPRTGWIPLPHSHLLVLGSRPYLSGRHLVRRGAAPDTDPDTDPEPHYFNAALAGFPVRIHHSGLHYGSDSLRPGKFQRAILNFTPGPQG
jgi:hypothetical protein